MAGIGWLDWHDLDTEGLVILTRVCCADELVTTLKEMLAGQMASQAAMLGAMKSGFAAKDKTVDPHYNWLITHAGVDVVAASYSPSRACSASW